MKRPILIAVIGYIIGIIWGLYIKFSIALLYTIIIITTVCIKKIKRLSQKNLNVRNSIKSKLKLFSISRYFRYIKLIINYKVICLIIISSIISNTIILLKNQKYDNLYKNCENIELVGSVEDLKNETQYKKIYVINVKYLNNINEYKNTKLYINVDPKYNLNYGDNVKIKGEFKEPQIARNYGGFSYKNYLKTLDIYGTINVTSIQILNIKNKNVIQSVANNIRNKIKENAKKYLDENTYSIYLGLIIGDTSKIEENVKKQFQESNMSHILAISGMHISYIVLGITIVFNNICGKSKAKSLTIIILIIYNLITGFSPSIMRATIMGIMNLISGLINRKNDTWTSISISIFIILIYNPYLITSLGFQFSCAGTIGIILFNKTILDILNKGENNTSKIKTIISISLSAQILILPLTIWHSNKLGIYFLLSNLILGFIIGPIVIIGFVFLIFLIFNFKFISIISIILNICLNVIIFISNVSILPLSKIYIRTINIVEIILFYSIIVIINIIYQAKQKKNKTVSDYRMKYILESIKYKIRENKIKYKKIIKYIISLLIIAILIINIFLIKNIKNLTIHFVDVGQGDCCFIELPNNKTILIDGGGSNSDSFDIGEKTLIPYILDRGYTKIDYILISHFDTDHVRTEY